MATAVANATITQADLEELADLANLKIVPQNYSRTNADPPDVISGSFTFPEIDGTEPQRAWGDELDRIWCSLFDPWQDDLDPTEYSITYGANFGTDANPLFSIVSGANADRVAEVLDYWWTLQVETPRETVVSNGPHLWTYCDLSPGTKSRVRAFRTPKFVFSSMDCQPFTLRSGFILGTVDEPYRIIGDGLHHTNAAPATVSFDYSLPGAILYGDVYFYFTAPDESETYPSDHDISFSGWGSGASGTWEHVDTDLWKYHLGSDGIKNLIDNSGSGDVSGTLEFRAYVNDTGWVYAGFGMVGIIQTASDVLSSSSSTTEYNVIHPRNASMRSATHLSNDPHFRVYSAGAPFDILDLDSLVTQIRDQSNPPASYLYDVITEPLETYIDEYPGGANDSLIEPALLDVLNQLVDGPNLYDTGSWSGVTLRDSTQWLLDNDPQGGIFLQVLNRLLLEDAFPSELRRLPESDFDKDEEVRQVEATDVDADTYSFDQFAPGVWLTLDGAEATDPVGKIAGIWICEAWPQPVYHTFLDGSLPHYYGNLNNLSSLRDNASVYGSSLVELGTSGVATPNLPSTWPALPTSAFGKYNLGPGNGYTGDAYAHMQAVVPYWNNDSHHRWFDDGYLAPIAPGGHQNFMLHIDETDSNPLLESKKYEISFGNPDLHIYVGTDIPVLDNPSSYLFIATGGAFRFPEDFLNNGLTPSTYFGTDIYYTAYNPTTGVIVPHLVRSEFYYAGDENYEAIVQFPPWSEPLFIPRFNHTDSEKYNMALEPSQFLGGLVSDWSYRFTPFDSNAGWGSTTQRAMPRPHRGYCVTGLIIRNKSAANAGGIYRPQVADSQIKIGIMAGTGVFAGAIWGVYPGEFIEFGTYTLTGVSEKVVEVFWPVLEGCPLAFQSVVGEHTVTAMVDFQPGVNVGFRSRFNFEGAEQQGDYCGKPDFRAHFLTVKDRNAVISTLRKSSVVMPTISARSFNDLSKLLFLMPDI